MVKRQEELIPAMMVRPALRSMGCRVKRTVMPPAAVVMAERRFVEVYDERVLKQRPWRVTDTGDAFLVRGTLPSGRRGGTAQIWLRKSDGLILELIHYR